MVRSVGKECFFLENNVWDRRERKTQEKKTKRKNRRGKKRHCSSFVIIVFLVCHRTNFRLSTLRKAATETWGTGRGSKPDGHFIGPASTVVLQLCTIASSTMAYRGASSVSENRASIRDFSSSPSQFILLIFTLLSAFLSPSFTLFFHFLFRSLSMFVMYALSQCTANEFYWWLLVGGGGVSQSNCNYYYY